MPYFSRDNRRIAYFDSGGPAEPLLLLHGLGSRSQDWQVQINAFVAEYRVLALDFPGHGESEPIKGNITMEDLADDAVALLDHLAISATYVVGYSLGGMVAFQLAAKFPHRLKAMIIINSGPGFTGNLWRLRLKLTIRSLVIRLLGLPAVGRKIVSNLFPRDTQHELRQQFMLSIAIADQGSYLRILHAINRFSVQRTLAECFIPSLILCGDQDYTPVEYKKTYAALMPKARVRVINNSTHATPMDQPGQCNEAILHFLHSL